jgi:hypothetical protein
MIAFPGDLYFPRSAGQDWRALLGSYDAAAEDLANTAVDLRHAQFHPAGERRATEADLLEWREDLNAWAYAEGFPAPLNEASRSAWDVALGVRLLEDTEHLPESQHPDVWCWLATHLLPHFIVYRWGWPNMSGDEPPTGRAPWTRFGNTDKNGLLVARHRIRAYGPDLAKEATEQEFQSIQFRPAFGIDQRVARVVLETLITSWQDPDSNYGKNGGTRTLDANDVCIEIRLINSLRPLCFAPDAEIVEIVNDIIHRLPSIRRATTLQQT